MNSEIIVKTGVPGTSAAYVEIGESDEAGPSLAATIVWSTRTVYCERAADGLSPQHVEVACDADTPPVWTGKYGGFYSYECGCGERMSTPVRMYRWKRLAGAALAQAARAVAAEAQGDYDRWERIVRRELAGRIRDSLGTDRSRMPWDSDEPYGVYLDPITQLITASAPTPDGEWIEMTELDLLLTPANAGPTVTGASNHG